MRLAVTADCHIGNHRRFGGPMTSSVNDRARLVLGAFSASIDVALEKGVTVYAVAGDLLDYARPEAPLLRAVQRELKRARDGGVKRIFLMVGNHEQVSLAAGDHALAPLAPYATVVEQPRVETIEGVDLLMVPFRPGRAADWLPDTLRDMLRDEDSGTRPSPSGSDGRGRVLLVHLGIRDADTAPWLKNAHDAIDVELLADLCTKHGIRTVFAGNWHDRKRWDFPVESEEDELCIQQLGALAPTGWDNPGLTGYGTVGLFGVPKPYSMSFIEVPGPRFIKLGFGEEIPEANGNTLFVSTTAAPENVASVLDHLARKRAAGEIVAMEVLPDQVVAKQEARAAAASARSAETMDEALSSFVANMPMKEGVDREAVAARCRRYLG